MPRRVASTRSKALGVPPSLDVPEGGRARLDSGARLDYRGEHLADAAEPCATKGVESSLAVGVIHRIEGEAFRHATSGARPRS